MGYRVWDLLIGSIVFTFLGLTQAQAVSRCVLSMREFVPTKLSQAALDKLEAAKPREIVTLYVRLKPTELQPETLYMQIEGTPKMWVELLKNPLVARVMLRPPTGGAIAALEVVRRSAQSDDRLGGGLPAPDHAGFGAMSPFRPPHPRSESFAPQSAPSNPDALPDPGFH